jgi:NADPH:quinone reductase-like Zn-dependent oxidoreductase
MKAMRAHMPGGPEVMGEVGLPPEPQQGQLRVRLAAIGVNYADMMCRRAVHASMRPPPIVPGCESAGLVDACGPGVMRRRIGERVGVYSPFGVAYAESLVVPEHYALHLPEAMPYDEAAAFVHLSLTAHAALHGQGPVPPGATLLVTAAAVAWAALCTLYAAGRLRPRISRSLPPSQAAEVHRLQESRASVDKLLLFLTGMSGTPGTRIA